MFEALGAMIATAHLVQMFDSTMLGLEVPPMLLALADAPTGLASRTFPELLSELGSRDNLVTITGHCARTWDVQAPDGEMLMLGSSTRDYNASLRLSFTAYRSARFAGQDHFFEARPEGDAVVFDRDHVALNLLIPPSANTQERQQIIGLVPPAQRHRHFGSMRSSQALTQSVFGTIKVLDHLRLLSSVVAEDGRPAFGPTLNETTLELEKPVGTLGEQPGRSTSVDVWWGSGPYRVAVECKLSEATFGTCSRPRLDPKDAQHCDGSYAQQGERKARCALTEIGIRYWNYADDLFGWRAEVDHQPCPLQSSYQLVRNILAACVKDDGSLSVDNGHALIIYDGRNPTMASGGDGDRQWWATYSALRPTGVLRRLSWQAFIAQWPIHPAFDWMKNELGAKYGIIGAS